MKFVAVNWEYVERLCRKVAMQVLEDDFKPDKIVALAKGGWFVSMVLSDYLGVGIVNLDLKEGREVKVKKALIVDDFINTGKTMRSALERVKGEVKTCALLMFQNSRFFPDYLAEFVSDDVWVVFPWNFVEDISPLILSALEKSESDIWGIRESLSSLGVDYINLEIAHPGKMEEVLSILEKRKMIERFEEQGKVYWRLKK
uniref:Phosphoribosyltransferase n=1 Tax=Archaeoglobus fulgidus TaxID=2234 RepID=A0A7J3M564_ARCFL